MTSGTGHTLNEAANGPGSDPGLRLRRARLQAANCKTGVRRYVWSESGVPHDSMSAFGEDEGFDEPACACRSSGASSMTPWPGLVRLLALSGSD
jgi:hypothetical protein